MARLGPSSSSSFEVWVWASSCLLRAASRCLSMGRKRDGEDERKEKEIAAAAHNSVDEITILLQLPQKEA